MLAHRFIFLFALAFLSTVEVRGAEAWARFLSPELRQTEKRLGELERELKNLPELIAQPFASRYGYRSKNLKREDETQWIVIDLGRMEEITRIVAVPVHVPKIGTRGAGYGFPKRFRIEVADNHEMKDAVIVVDRTKSDVSNPGRYPMDFPVDRIKGRYIKFSATKLFAADEGFIWAMEELMVLSGNRSVALYGQTKSSSSVELYPNWSSQRLIDGQTALGIPIDLQNSPTKGYLSTPTEQPDAKKWITVDLGSEQVIDEVRLLPVIRDSFEQAGLMSFPRGFFLELARDADFADVTWSYPFTGTNTVGFPGWCAMALPTKGKIGRYLRLTTTALWGKGIECGYALAEIQAYSGNENVALGKMVTASDAVETDGWSLAAAVDGFSSRKKLIELPQHLDAIARRGELEKERNMLLTKRTNRLNTIDRMLRYSGIALGVSFALSSAWLLLRQRINREKAVTLLRDQIARDLHDDIGSNLGGIVLLSELGKQHSSDAQSRDDFQIIKEAADEASASMRDIVWLIDSKHANLKEQITKMRQSAQLILGDKEISFSQEPENVRDQKLSLLFRRHVLFAFKETLNNIRKHAQASEISIEIRLDSNTFSFTIRDNGVGFALNDAELSGHGLANLKRRAERLGGTLRIHSARNEGSVVTFSAPLRS